MGHNTISTPFPSYIIVVFIIVTVPEEYKSFSDKVSNWIPIPIASNIGNYSFCSVTTLTFRVCISIIIYKPQGMYRYRKIIWKISVHLPISTSRHISGLKLIILSRVKDINCLAIGSTSTKTIIMALMNIDSMLAYEKRKNFIRDIKYRSISALLLQCNQSIGPQWRS